MLKQPSLFGHMVSAGRVRMNSENLQQTFPDVYREFFAQCPVVISAPGSFFWSSGLAVIYGGAGILQKLPLRVYVGLEPDSTKLLKWGDYMSFVPHLQQFERFYHDKAYSEGFLRLLNELQKKIAPNTGGKLHILSEVPRGAGLNQSGAVNASMACILAISGGHLNANQLEAFTKAPTPEVVREPVVQQILRAAWKLEACAHDDIGSGSAPFAAFLESTSPLIFFSERRGGSYSDHPAGQISSNIEGHYEVIDQIGFSGYRLKDLFGWRSDVAWPIDFGLMYLGQQKHSSIFLKPMRVVKQDLDRLANFVGEYLRKLSGSEKTADSAFYGLTQQGGSTGYWERSTDFLLTLSAKAVFDLKQLLENGTAESLDELCETVQLQERVYEFFTKGLPSSGERDILMHVKQVLRDKSSNGFRSIRLLPDRPDGGGDLLFIAPQGYLQDNLETFITQLRTQVNPLARLDYASWIDGSETGGARVEQHFAEKRFSPFVSSGTVQVREWQREPAPIEHVYSLEAFSKEKNSIDLLLNAIEPKIFVRGVALTSKDIKSAKATIEILKILLQKLGEDVPASALPSSTYIERNEMQSKILTPLVQSFRRITGKRFPLTLKGGLRKNFTIKLAPSDYRISIIEREL